MTRKRKKDNISPATDNKEPKRKMATNTNFPNNSTQPNVSQVGQSFMLPPIPPMYSSPTYYMNPQTSPILQQPPPPTPTMNVDMLQCIIQRLDSMDSKLGQLSSIQERVNKITDRLNNMEQKITDMEHSQSFMSDQYDKVMSSSNVNKQNISSLRTGVDVLTAENRKLKSDSETVAESILDLKCRSMRDNLLFFGIPEGFSSDPVFSDTDSPSDEDPNPSSSLSNEKCAEKVFVFCEKVLKIDNPKSRINIIRAHRIGKFTSGKTRPIVAKFDNDSKFLIKDALKGAKLQMTPYNVTDQYPQEIKDRRKELIPVMLEARKAGKKAVLVRDKLYINNIIYTGDGSQ